MVEGTEVCPLRNRAKEDIVTSDQVGLALLSMVNIDQLLKMSALDRV